MKKLLMNAAIATGFALFAGNAFAGDDNAFTSSIGFEGNNQGMLNLWGDDGRGDENTYWNTSGDVESTFVTNYTDTAVTPPAADNRPDLFAGAANNNFLKIDSPNGFERYMQLGGAAQSLESDVFVDMNVQFTVSDTVLDLGENTDHDKLAIWLYAPDTEGAETNLVITAAELDGDKEPALKNFVVDGVDIQPDTWYRLTVRAVGESGFPPKFSVYIDGDEDKLEAVATLAADGTKTSLVSAVSDFYSLVKYAAAEPTTTTLSSVTFQGVGALDDLTFTTKEPSFFPVEVAPFAIEDKGEYATLAAAIDAAEDGDVITMKANYTLGGEEYVEISELDLTLDIGSYTLTCNSELDVITITDGNFTVLGTGSIISAGEIEESMYVAIVAGGAITIGDENGTPSIDRIVIDPENDTVKFYNVANPTVVIYDYNSSEITGTWEAEEGETGYYVFTPGGEEPPTPSEGYDGGDGTNKFTIDSTTEETLEAKLQPTGKTLASTVSETSSMTYAQAYALGLWDAEAEEVEDLEATISFDEKGKVVVSLANEPATGYLVTCKVYEKASLTAEWPTEPITTYAYGSEQAIEPASATAGFYKVEVTISNAFGN